MTTPPLTLGDWRAVYRAGARPRDLLVPLLDRLNPKDPAWICRADREWLEQQLQRLERGDRGDAAALRRSLRRQGQHRRRRLADHRRAARRSATSPLAHATVVAPPARGRRGADRQDQPGPVRHRPGRHALAVRRACRTPSIRRASAAARAPDRRRPSRAAWCRSRSAPTPRDRAGCRRASTTSSGLEADTRQRTDGRRRPGLPHARLSSRSSR
ncbi:MAG: hypothetical protein MZW92_60380 [Comamonadaceae bacterium]|nr:hypothetical protein [Comamonadaceae bacterium]